MGGRQQGLGVGGLETGGGIHFLSRKYGWVCDNICAYEVVLGNGTVITATASSHRDLWLALKGGSNNFGIVTRFDTATFNLNAMWGGALLMNGTQAVVDAHAQAFSDYMLPENFDPLAHGGTLLTHGAGEYFVADTIYYAAPVTHAPVWKNFTSIQPQIVNTLGLSTAAKLVDAGSGKFPTNATRSNTLAFTFRTEPAELYAKLFQIWKDGSKPLESIQALSLVVLIQPQPVTNGTSSLGIAPNQRDLVTGNLFNAWPSKDDDETVMKGTYTVFNQLVTLLKQRGLYVEFEYLKYADIHQDVISSYGPAAKASLQAASRKYDPNGVFQTQISGGFKLAL